MKKLLLLLLCVPLIGLGNDSINTEIQDAILSIPAEERRQILRGIQFKNSPHLMPQEHSISREKYNEIDRLVDGPFSLNDKSLDDRINYLKKEEKKQWFLISFIIIACVLLFFILKKITYLKHTGKK